MAAELKTLGKCLSEDHDLAILREKVLEQLDETDDRTDIEALVALLDQRRNELQVIARTLERGFTPRNLEHSSPVT